MKKKSVVLVILVTLIWAGLAMAGEPTIQKGSASIFFPFNGLATLSFDNTYFGAQYFVINKVALAAGFRFDSERDRSDKDDDPEIDRTIEVDGGIYYYPFQKGPVALYVAPQGGLELSSSYLKKVRDCKYRTLWAGLSIGVEWWVFDRVGLSASNWFGLEYYWGTEEDLVNDTKDEPRNLKLGMMGLSTQCVYISYYFK